SDYIVVRCGLPGTDRSSEARPGQHELDLRIGAGYVELPEALALKYPNSSRELGWQWIFAATRMYRDHMTGERRRHHLDESVLQRAVQEAVRGAGLHKPVRCHTFRQMCSCTFDLLPRPESGLGRCS